MNYQNELKKVGLYKSESTVYLYLLENGISTPPQISKGTKIARTNCYNILRSLKDKGLIQEQKRANRKAYLANDPKSLLGSLEKRKQTLRQIIPDLQAFYTAQKNKPKIIFFDGWHEVKEIYSKTLEAKVIFGIGSSKNLMEVDKKFFEQWHKKLKQKNIVLYDILDSASQKKAIGESQMILKGLYNVKLLPGQEEVTTDVFIWNNKIGIISLQDPIFGTVLESENVSATLKIIFNCLFNLL